MSCTSKLHEYASQGSIYTRTSTFKCKTFIINIQENAHPYTYIQHIHYFFAAAFACGSLAVHRDLNALSISLLVNFAPFITSFSPSTVRQRHDEITHKATMTDLSVLSQKVKS